MAQHMLIKDGVIVNVVEWDGVVPWSPPGSETVVAGSGPIGWKWEDGRAIDPSPPAQATEPGKAKVL
jgi:hypothetical protein